MIYLLADTFVPNTATTNRYLGFAKGFKEQGLDFVNVSVKPSKDLYRLDKRTYGKAKYLWFGKHSVCKSLNTLIYGIHIKIISKSGILLRLFFRSLSKEDVVILTSPQQVACAVKNNRKGYRIYHERTEHPNVSRSWADEKAHAEYIKACTQLDGLFVISTSLRDTFIEFGVLKEKIHIINMTVDQSRFEGLKKQNTESYIAYCGTISNFKDGVDSLIKSFGIVAKYNKEIKLYIIGPVQNRSVSNSNIELIKKLHLEDRIVLTGLVSADKMPQMLKNAKILVLARPDNLQAKNGFPTKLGEYLLTENPVVITRTGDIPLFLQDGKNAMLAEAGDEAELAEKILYLLANTSHADEIGRCGKLIALKDFNNKIEAQKVIKIIT